MCKHWSVVYGCVVFQLPKQYPYQGKDHYTFETVDGGRSD